MREIQRLTDEDGPGVQLCLCIRNPSCLLHAVSADCPSSFTLDFHKAVFAFYVQPKYPAVSESLEETCILVLR